MARGSSTLHRYRSGRLADSLTDGPGVDRRIAGSHRVRRIKPEPLPDIEEHDTSGGAGVGGAGVIGGMVNFRKSSSL